VQILCGESLAGKRTSCVIHLAGEDPLDIPVAIAFTSIPLRITRFASNGQVVNDY
jgi:hypothetical protein